MSAAVTLSGLHHPVSRGGQQQSHAATRWPLNAPTMHVPCSWHPHPDTRQGKQQRHHHQHPPNVSHNPHAHSRRRRASRTGTCACSSCARASEACCQSTPASCPTGLQAGVRAARTPSTAATAEPAALRCQTPHYSARLHTTRTPFPHNNNSDTRPEEHAASGRRRVTATSRLWRRT
jgi:hypothetical protein